MSRPISTTNSYYSSNYYSSHHPTRLSISSLDQLKQSLALASYPPLHTNATIGPPPLVTSISAPTISAITGSNDNTSRSQSPASSTTPTQLRPTIEPGAASNSPQNSDSSPSRKKMSSTPRSLSRVPSVDLSNPKDKKLANFIRILNSDSIELPQLRELAWNGVPSDVRSDVWKVLLGYMPIQKRRREATLLKRHTEYRSYIDTIYVDANNSTSEHEQTTLRQIRADIPRTCPGVAFFRLPAIRNLLERALYIFAIRHPASGYVQGMNDLMTPFMLVYWTEYSDIDILSGNTEKALTSLSDEDLFSYEADCYWSLSILLDSIQDHYTFAQPGIQRQIYKLHELVERIDQPLTKHLDSNSVQFLHFAFRWMNCLLMREISLPLLVRIWDTYLAEEKDGFKSFHLYVCAAFLMRFATELKKMEFAQLVQFLQRLPTEQWTDKDIELVLAQAFLYKSLFHESRAHLT